MQTVRVAEVGNHPEPEEDSPDLAQTAVHLHVAAFVHASSGLLYHEADSRLAPEVQELGHENYSLGSRRWAVAGDPLVHRVLLAGAGTVVHSCCHSRRRTAHSHHCARIHRYTGRIAVAVAAAAVAVLADVVCKKHHTAVVPVVRPRDQHTAAAGRRCSRRCRPFWRGAARPQPRPLAVVIASYSAERFRKGGCC